MTAANLCNRAVDHTLGKLAKLGPDEAELAERGRLIVESCKDAASTVITVVGGYRHYRRINDKLGLYRKDYIGTDLDELFAAEAPNSETADRHSVALSTA